MWVHRILRREILREIPLRIQKPSMSYKTNLQTFRTRYTMVTVGDPDDHLDSYLDWMNMQGASDAVKCRVFPLTLSGDARTWYGSLKRQSISSFNELSKEFCSGFAASRRRRRHMYATAEDISDSKSHATSAEHFEAPRRWGRQTRDKGKEPQMSRQVNTGNTARNTRFPLRDKFEEYTSLRFPLDRILEIANKEKLLRKPKPLYSAPEMRDRRIHCKFHNDHGHETRKCRDLRDQVEELVRNGKLLDCVKPQESSEKITKAQQHQSHQTPVNVQDSDDEEPINFIDVVPVTGDPRSTSSRKALASVCLTTTPEDAPRHWVPLSFSTEDSYEIRYPHCDALVISVKIGNHTVKRTLIDHGSSLDIIHWDPLQNLGYTIPQLQASRYCIRGIGGHRTKPVGQIDLPVRFGTRPRIRTVWVSFQVIDIPFPFNILIGRPTLYTLRAATSIYSLKLKFPTELGPGEVTGDQEEYKRCIQIGSNPILIIGNYSAAPVPRRNAPKQ
ncbi:hypothetical protein EZV62_018729 [Acer yangbiense]|uniref:Retrotransposon gag domain-containing protein n=1 Tax=Acer yangbiense TaxID=1000413 RepID=A0A5C7HMA3_9ROSI|nr:hypothetical protein EZV62_018729 [Acer yangbiense]